MRPGDGNFMARSLYISRHPGRGSDSLHCPPHAPTPGNSPPMRSGHVGSASGGANSRSARTWKSCSTPTLISRTWLLSVATCTLRDVARGGAPPSPHWSAEPRRAPGRAGLPASSRAAGPRSLRAGGMARECARVGAGNNPWRLRDLGRARCGDRL